MYSHTEPPVAHIGKLEEGKGFVHGTYGRWLLRTLCSCVKESRPF